MTMMEEDLSAGDKNAAIDTTRSKADCEKVEGIPRFETQIPDEDSKFTHDHLHTMQVNVGKLCNLACKHCHIGAGPNHTEIMDRSVLEDCLAVLDANDFTAVDLTGGAPEMNPSFEWFIDELAQRKIHTMVRSNLVVLTLPEYAHLPEVFTKLGIEVVASLPAYTERECDSQRGKGTFQACISMLKKLNSLGYGKGEGLILNLVYNPRGAFLPPSQEAMTIEYRQRLSTEYDIVFDNLFTITNNPIGRFGDWLECSGNMEGYMQRLSGAFNPATCAGAMCRDQISVDWRGLVYDCDFNQVCEMPIEGPHTVHELADKPLGCRHIRFGQHCYACTAGAGSSCGGTTV